MGSRDYALPAMVASLSEVKEPKQGGEIRSPRKAPRVGTITKGPAQVWTAASPTSVVFAPTCGVRGSHRQQRGCPARPNSPAVDDDLSVSSFQSVDDCFEPRDSPKTRFDFGRAPLGAPMDLPMLSVSTPRPSPPKPTPRSLFFGAREEPGGGRRSPTAAARSGKVAPESFPGVATRAPTPRHAFPPRRTSA